MKGQQIFHSFLPGVTVAVLTTQSAWANTVNLDGVRLPASPSVSSSIFSRTLAGQINNMQLPSNVRDDFPALIPVASLTVASMQPSLDSSNWVAVTEKTGVPIAEIPNQYTGAAFSLTPSPPDVVQSGSQNPSTQINQQPLNVVSLGQKVENTVVGISPVKSTPTANQINPQTQLPTVREGIASGVNSAKLLDQVEFCPQETGKPNRRVPNCSQTNLTGSTVAQRSTPTQPPGSAVQTPDLLNPSSNPLQFPTKPEEVRVQGTQAITLAQALELARRNNQELIVASLQLQRSQSALREAQAALLPTVGISANVARQQSAQEQLSVEARRRAQEGLPPQLRTPIESDQPSSGLTGQAQLRYDLYTSGARQARIRASEEQVRSQELDVERVSEEIRLNVSTDYYNLQQADETVRISQSAVTNAEASLRDAQALERAGVGTRFDVLRSQVNLANAAQDLTNAASQQQVSRRQLATRLSLGQTASITAADPVRLAGLWNQPLEQSIILAFQNRPELQQQLAQRNISEQQRRLALSELGPQLSLVASYNLLDQFNDNIRVTDGYSLGLTANLNLYDGGAARARAAQQKANIAIAETNFSGQRNQIRFQVEQAFTQQQSSLENVQTANAALDQAREALRLARLRFQAGVGTQTDVIAAENDLTRAEGNRVRAILDYNRALANLQRAVTSRAFR